jgi:hypothetical protein
LSDAKKLSRGGADFVRLLPEAAESERAGLIGERSYGLGRRWPRADYPRRGTPQPSFSFVQKARAPRTIAPAPTRGPTANTPRVAAASNTFRFHNAMPDEFIEAVERA